MTPDGPVFAGKVGSGLTGRWRAACRSGCTPGATARCRRSRRPRPAGRVVHWVEPEIVVEVKYTLMTAEGRLRQPVFLRVRDDKTVEEANG